MGVQNLHETIREGSEKRRIWAICDRLHATQGHVPSGRDVVDIYVATGGNEGTGFTQYSHWKKALEEARSRASADDSAHAMDSGNVDSVPLAIDSQGRLFLPPELREAMLLGADGKVTARVENGELRVIAPRVALRRAQEIARKYKKPGESVVDEFLAGRRAMWGEE